MFFFSFAQLLQDQVHEIGYAKYSKFYVFRGGKEYTEVDPGHARFECSEPSSPRPGQPMPPQTFGAARFLLSVSQCEFQLTGILESVATHDP
jgi:protein transport protein SEC23